MLSRMNTLFVEKALVPAESLEEIRAWINEDMLRVLHANAQHKEALKELMLLSQHLYEQTQDADYLYSYAMAALDLAYIDAWEQSLTDDIYTYTYQMSDKAFEAFRTMWEINPCEQTFQRVLEGMKTCGGCQSCQYGDEPRVDIEFERALQNFLQTLPKDYQNRLEVRRLLAASYRKADRYHQEIEELVLLDAKELRLTLEERRHMQAKWLEILRGIWEETLDAEDEWRYKDAQRQVTEMTEQKPAETQQPGCMPAPIEAQTHEKSEKSLTEKYPLVPLVMDSSLSMTDIIMNSVRNRRKR